MALTAEAFDVVERGPLNDLPVKTGVLIFEGAAVGVEVATGYARPLVAGDLFAGWATLTVNNTAGADGAVDINVETPGVRKVLNVPATVITSYGANVYASDDGTYTLVVGSNTLIGTVIRFVSAGVVVVQS